MDKSVRLAAYRLTTSCYYNKTMCRERCAYMVGKDDYCDYLFQCDLKTVVDAALADRMEDDGK